MPYCLLRAPTDYHVIHPRRLGLRQVGSKNNAVTEVAEVLVKRVRDEFYLRARAPAGPDVAGARGTARAGEIPRAARGGSYRQLERHSSPDHRQIPLPGDQVQLGPLRHSRVERSRIERAGGGRRHPHRLHFKGGLGAGAGTGIVDVVAVEIYPAHSVVPGEPLEIAAGINGHAVGGRAAARTAVPAPETDPTDSVVPGPTRKVAYAIVQYLVIAVPEEQMLLGVWGEVWQSSEMEPAAESA